MFPRRAAAHNDEKRTARQTAARKVRAKLRHAAFTHMPMRLTGGRLSKSRAICRIDVVDHAINLPRLPHALDGMRIAHLSDLHVGDLTRPDSLPDLVKKTNAINADLIAVTGDFVDLSLKVLDPVIEAMAALKAPLGVYLVPGNHDYLDDGPDFVRRFRQANLNLLVNESIILRRGDHRITVAGIDYPHQRPDLSRYVRQTMKRASDGHGRTDLRLLLAHHPDAFDTAADMGVDLTLSGHTHGGQVIFRNRGKKGSQGLGSLSFQYPRGLFQRDNSHLYVTTGVGSWFPLRVKCPAEIACLTLRTGPSS